jgi:hypothetical protein
MSDPSETEPATVPATKPARVPAAVPPFREIEVALQGDPQIAWKIAEGDVPARPPARSATARRSSAPARSAVRGAMP